jgi:uncharacterized protein YbjT (DUF2867 family)
VILVTGATGNVGRELVGLLADAGEPVRALVRRDSDRSKLPEDAEVAIGDLNSADGLGEALSGVSAIHLLAGYDGLDGMLAEARRAGVERVVLQSSSAVPSGDLDNAVARYHILSERAVRDSGLPWTFLQPNTFMSNALRWADRIRSGEPITAPFAEVAISTIDPFDIASVSAKALTSADHEGRSYRLSGPESLLPAEQVAILGDVLGRELRFEPLSNDQARAEMSAQMPAEYVDAFFSFFADETLDETTVRPTVAEVLGREPHSFEHWATEHADAFR